MSPEVTTCALSLLRPLYCCEDGCMNRPILALLDASYVEHIRCASHVDDALVVPDNEHPNIAIKPLKWDGMWAP